VPGSNGVVYFLKRVFKQCRKAGKSTWQSPGLPWPLYWDWLSRCYDYKCGTSCSWKWVFPVPHRERTGEFSNCPLGLLQSLLRLLHKSYSDPLLSKRLWGSWGLPTAIHIGSSLSELFTTSWSPCHSGLCQFKITIFALQQGAHQTLSTFRFPFLSLFLLCMFSP
jgi:hypothetical protein